MHLVSALRSVHYWSLTVCLNKSRTDSLVRRLCSVGWPPRTAIDPDVRSRQFKQIFFSGRSTCSFVLDCKWIDYSVDRLLAELVTQVFVCRSHLLTSAVQCRVAYRPTSASRTCC